MRVIELDFKKSYRLGIIKDIIQVIEEEKLKLENERKNLLDEIKSSIVAKFGSSIIEFDDEFKYTIVTPIQEAIENVTTRVETTGTDSVGERN